MRCAVGGEPTVIRRPRRIAIGRPEQGWLGRDAHVGLRRLPQIERHEAGAAGIVALQQVDRGDRIGLAVDDHVLQPFAEEGLDSRLERGLGGQHVGHQAVQADVGVMRLALQSSRTASVQPS